LKYLRSVRTSVGAETRTKKKKENRERKKHVIQRLRSSVKGGREVKGDGRKVSRGKGCVQTKDQDAKKRSEIHTGVKNPGPPTSNQEGQRLSQDVLERVKLNLHGVGMARKGKHRNQKNA